MLEFKDLTIKRKEKTIIKNLNLIMPTDSVLAVMGPSGIGKSSLISAICQLLPYTGELLWQKKTLDTKNITIGWLPQDYGLFPWLKIKQNISQGMMVKNNHSISKEDWQKIKSLCQKLEVESLLDKFPGELSGGQKQRVALAKVLLLKPDLLLLDEPFSALDDIVKKQAYNLLAQELAAYKTTSIIVTHNLQEAVIFGQQILSINQNGWQIIKNPLAKTDIKDRLKSPQFESVVQQLRGEVQQKWFEN